MNYIFLDIDGVLITINNTNLVVYTFEKIAKKRFPFNVQWNRVDRRCLKNLQKLVFLTKSKIILSSTWRLEKTGIDILDNYLKKYGLEIFDITNNINMDRGLEILNWLQNNNFNSKKDNFIIIDDNIEDIEKVFSSNRIVKTNRKFGFNGNSLIEACYKLLIK